MTDLERDIRVFILRALNHARGPLTDSTLRQAIKNGFMHIAFTAVELGQHIGAVEEASLIAGTNDDTFGLMWDLTPKGQIKAQQLK